MNRVNKACAYYPCHKNLEDCTFCYCPYYPCGNTERGKWLKNGIWDCSDCEWIHQKKTVDEIFELIRQKKGD